MKKVPYILVCIAILFVVAIITLFTINKLNNSQSQTLGVWWWDNRLDTSYLDFAKENGVTEIYYYTSSFNEKTNEFIKQANKRNMKVFWLDGDYRWIETPELLNEDIAKYLKYQETYENKFSGMHLDIEPHQDPNFEAKRETMLYKFITLTYNLKIQYPDIWIEYDIPIWLNDNIEFRRQTKPTYAHIIDNASAVTLMSYRDTSERIYDSAKDEIEYAISVGKKLNLGVETGEQHSETFVSFYEEGKRYMYEEIEKVRQQIPKNFGIAIHHIYDWYNLKD